MRLNQNSNDKKVTIASVILMLAAIVIGAFFLPKVVVNQRTGNQIEFREQPSQDSKIQRIEIDSREASGEEGQTSRDR